MHRIHLERPPLIISFVFCTCIFASGADYLIRIDASESNGLPVVEIVDDKALIVAGEKELEEIVCRGIKNVVLDVNPASKQYLFVFSTNSAPEGISRYGTVIDQYNECVLLRTTEEMIPELNRLKMELSRLTMRPIVRRDIGVYDFENIRITRDTLIEQMLNEVDPDSIFQSVLRLQQFYTRYSTSDSNRIVAVNWIKDRFIEYGCDSVYTQTFSATYGDNVVGIEIGKQNPSIQTYVLMGAHLDDVPSYGYAPGADDNASGVAAVLEAARVMRNYSFANTVRFAAFNAEEQGLIGSDSLASFANSQSDTVIAALCYDMIGHLTGPGMDTMRLRYTSAVPGCSLFACVFYHAVADTYTQLNIRDVRYTGTTGSSDHASFWRNGYVSTGGIELILCPGYHTIGDSIGPTGFNSIDLAALITRTAVAVFATLAVPIDTAVGINALSPSEIPSQFAIRPNPGCVFAINFAVRADVEFVDLAVYDCVGRIVDKLAWGQFQKGIHSFVWDGVTSSGAVSAPGVYFISLVRDGERQCRKIIFTRNN
jgi:hypothetical protein